ncbi:Bifunctional purine biosynthesis protein PurH [Sorochytrium milnesiophthora]
MAFAVNHNWRNSILPINRQPARVTGYLVFSAFTASLGMLQFGYHISGLSSSQYTLTCLRQDTQDNVEPGWLKDSLDALSLPGCVPMTTNAFSVLNAVFSIGGLVGSLVTSPLSIRLGKKRSMLLLNGFLLAAPALLALSYNYWMLFLGRVVAGFGSGGSTAVIASYLSEISPPQHRGKFGSLTQIMLNAGLLVCGVMNTLFTGDLEWRVVLGWSFPLALLQVLLIPFIAPSPRDILAKKRVEVDQSESSTSELLSRRSANTSQNRASIVIDNTTINTVLNDVQTERLRHGGNRRQSVVSTRRQSVVLGAPPFERGSAGAAARRALVTQSICDSVFLRPLNAREEQASMVLRRLWGPYTDEEIIKRAIAKGKPPKPKKEQEDKLKPSMDGTDGKKDDAVSMSSSMWLRKRWSLLDVFRNKRYRYSVINLMLAHCALQASGINVYFAYSQQILRLLFAPQTAHLIFILIIAYHILAITVASTLLDKFGRKRLFMIAFVIMGVSATMLTIGMQLHAPALSLAAFFGAVTGFATGMGNVPYIVIGELVDANAIASAAGAALTVNWLTQFLLLVTFLPLLSVIGAYTFLIISGVLVILGILLYRWFPETKNRQIDDVIDEVRERFQRSFWDWSPYHSPPPLGDSASYSNDIGINSKGSAGSRVSSLNILPFPINVVGPSSPISAVFSCGQPSPTSPVFPPSPVSPTTPTLPAAAEGAQYATAEPRASSDTDSILVQRHSAPPVSPYMQSRMVRPMSAVFRPSLLSRVSYDDSPSASEEIL